MSDPAFVHPVLAAKAFLGILKKVEDEAYGEMTLPSDPDARMIAINTVHNILDRLDAAVRRHIRELESAQSDAKGAQGT